MFFKDLTKESSDTSDEMATKSYTDTLESLLRVGAHTNNLLWVGNMINCALDLCLQGELLKHGQVLSRKPKERLIDKKWSCYLLAAMSSSSSDNVTQSLRAFVCACVRSSGSFFWCICLSAPLIKYVNVCGVYHEFQTQKTY